MPRTNSSKGKFEEGLLKFKQGLKARGYPENIIERSLSEVKVASRQSALSRTQKPKGHECLLPFVTTYHPAVKNLKQILMEHWTLIHNQPLLKTIFTNLRSSATKRENPLKTCLWEQKFNLRAIVQRDHKSHMGSPCRSVYLYSHSKFHINTEATKIIIWQRSILHRNSSNDFSLSFNRGRSVCDWHVSINKVLVREY